MDIAIIADDLSGANDTAVAFRKQGIKTCVVNYPEGFENELIDCDLLSASTNTRDLESSEAEKILRVVTKSLMKMGVKRVYKKIDSTWRGNIGRETQTIMEELNVRIAVICSSFPDLYRTIKDGHLFVNGKPIQHTPIAFDPCKPMKTSYLPEILQAQTDIPVYLLNYEDVSMQADENLLFAGDSPSSDGYSGLSVELRRREQRISIFVGKNTGRQQREKSNVYCGCC